MKKIALRPDSGGPLPRLANETASTTALIRIHPTQFPQNLGRELLSCLKQGRVNPKFHYETPKQAAKWLKVHQAYSPSQNDKDCRVTYRRVFENTIDHISARNLQVIGLGCGHGQKEAQLLQFLARSGIQVSFTPVDVSVPLLLHAREAALPFLRGNDCVGLVCDLQMASDLPVVLDQMMNQRRQRLYTFFGVVPNSVPDRIFSQLAKLIRPEDRLLLSANLAPGADYQRGLGKVLPGYDNRLTREWLLTFLLDLGVERRDGAIRFRIEQDPSAPRRIVADFVFSRSRTIEVENHSFKFGSGESIRLFFSYRYTASLIESHLRRHNLQVAEQWITNSGEEGVFLCRRRPG